MSPALLPTEALALTWAAHLGAVTWEEVVSWADSWILRLGSPSAELLELSLSTRRPDEAWTLLRELARSGDSGRALALLSARLLDALEGGRVEAAFLASQLEGLERLSLPGVPDDVRLPAPPGEFSDAAHHLWFLLEAWNPEFTPDVTAEVRQMLRRFR